MTPFRAYIRRAFPYFAIAIGGFAVAYVLIYAFVLPSRVVPSKESGETMDSSALVRPIETPLDVADPGMTPPVDATIPMATTALFPVVVPNLEGMALPDARGVLNSLRLNIVVQRDTSAEAAPGIVLRQNPKPDAKVSANGTVTVVVSILPPEDSTAATPSRPLPPIQPATDPPPAPQETPRSDTTP